MTKELATTHRMVTTRIPLRIHNNGSHKSERRTIERLTAPRVSTNRKFMGNAVTHDTAFCAAGGAGEKVAFDSI